MSHLGPSPPYSEDQTLPPPLVTVVTPFYNTAKYLAECIESVLSQDYSNLDYVLLDNASTDGSGEIAQRFAERDQRIRLFRNQEVLPQLANYNRALSHLHDEAAYCKMAQADDRLLPGALAAMVDVAERHQQVGLVSSYYLEGLRLRGVGIPLDIEVVPGVEVIRKHFLDGFFLLGSPTTHLIRADIVRSRRPFYDEERLHADTEGCYEILQHWDLGFVHQVLSFNRVHPESITGRVADWNPDGLDKLILVYRYGPQFLDEEEFHRALIKAEEQYLHYLASAVLAFKPARFWRYHIDNLDKDGLWNGHTKRRILGYLLLEILDRIFNLKRTAGRIYRFVRRRG